MTAGTDLAVIETANYPAFNHSKDEIEQIVADNLGGQDIGEFDLTRLKVPAGGATIWEMETLAGTEAVKEITGIIVHTAQSRAWWPIPLDESKEGSTPPSCTSADARIGYGKQWATKEDPNPAGEPKQLACNACPHSQWGSGKNGGQACSLKGSWLILVEGSFLPIVVSLPTMSLKQTKRYMLGLAGQGIRFSDVVTKLHLEKAQSGPNTYAKVVPELVGPLSPEDAQKAREYGALLKPLFDRLPQEELVVPNLNGTDPDPAAPPTETDEQRAERLDRDFGDTLPGDEEA
jgi:hypothetical protein